jgi:hypothetical protein
VSDLLDQIVSSLSHFDDDPDDSTVDELLELFSSLSPVAPNPPTAASADHYLRVEAPAVERTVPSAFLPKLRQETTRSILKSRIPKELQSVFLASQRGEVVDEPPASGVASRVFRRDRKSKSYDVSFGDVASAEFGVQDPPMTIVDSSSRRRRCRWSSQPRSNSQSNSYSLPPKPRRSDFSAHHVGKRINASISDVGSRDSARR